MHTYIHTNNTAETQAQAREIAKGKFRTRVELSLVVLSLFEEGKDPFEAPARVICDIGPDVVVLLVTSEVNQEVEVARPSETLPLRPARLLHYNTKYKEDKKIRW
jgi:hypothetical protein